jgi:mono/diheme cytochrome c family protein
VEKIIAKGNLRTAMPPLEAHLSDAEITALAEYVLNISKEYSSLKDGAEFTVERPTHLDSMNPVPDMLERGGSLFQKNCAACHGRDGRGLGPTAAVVYDKDKFWRPVADLTDPLGYGGGNKASDIFMRLKMGITPPMPEFGKTLDDESLETVALYVKSLQKDSDKRTLISESEWNKQLPSKVRGEYLFRAMSCSLCHNPYDERGHYYPDMHQAGGVAVVLPGLGEFYSNNVTSHKDGLADWTEEEIVKVMTTGYAKDRRIEAFAMPWPFFAHLTEQDAKDIAVYIKGIQPVQNRIPKRKFYNFFSRMYSRIRQLIRLEIGRLEYPPFNVGVREVEGK